MEKVSKDCYPAVFESQVTSKKSHGLISDKPCDPFARKKEAREASVRFNIHRVYLV